MSSSSEPSASEPNLPHEPAADEDEPIVELKPFEIEAFFGGGSAAAPAEPELPEIPGYHVEAIIGRGATGVVYRARQTAVDRAVALKILHSELITNQRAVKRLKREARLAAKLAHPSIISAIDMGSVGGLWWYAMELVEGVPLSRRIAERRSLSERECLRLFSPLCDALQHAHEVGVVHRDIKPANILIDGRGRARLVDLGLAMSENDPSITKTGSTLGTPHYVSPEQARDPSQADIRSDLWSLGATMYHAVCGHPPFHSDGPESTGVAEILSRVLYEPIVDPREFTPGLSKGFSLVLRKCLTRDAERRYQEPWELVADIELLRERRRVDVSASDVDSYASRHHAWMGPALLGAGLMIAVGGTWLLTARPWEDKASPTVVERQATLADWPALEAVSRGLETGRLMPADALAELETPVLLDLPEGARILRNQLEVDIRTALDSRLREFMMAKEGTIEAALAERRFQAAEEELGERFGAALRATTGFRSLDALPKGSTQRNALQWSEELRTRVAEAHAEALRKAEQAMMTRFGLLVNQRLDEDLRAHRWRDAIDWLRAGDPEVWLQRAMEAETVASDGVEGARLAPFDLSGLTNAERRRVAAVIESRVQSTESEVRYRATAVLNDVRDFVKVEAQSLREQIEASTIRGDASVVESFDAAVAAKHKNENLDVAQLPLELASGYGEEIVKARDDLGYAEKRAREALALRGVEELERAAQPLVRGRDYTGARDLYQAARAEAWRVSTYAVLDARIREFSLLENVLQRAATGIEAARRERRELTFGQIPRVGKIDARPGEVLRLGFHFVPEFGTAGRILIHLRGDVSRARSGERVGRGGARLLEVEDVLSFAGLDASDGGELSLEEALATAAFLMAEGRPKEARNLIRLEEHGSDDRLAADLERRSRRALTAEPAEAAPLESRDEGKAASPRRPGRRSRVRSGADTNPAPFMRTFGTPNQATNSRDVRLVWRFSIDAAANRPELKHPIPDGPERVRAWNLQSWMLTADGMELLANLPEVSLFPQDVGPSIRLESPLDVNRRIRLDVEFTPGTDRPAGHIVAISLRGHHALIARNKMWFGGGNLYDLYEYVRRGNRGRYEGFEQQPCEPLIDGQPVKFSIELSPGALDRLELNGKSLGFHRLQAEPSRPDSFIRIRSLRPLAVTAVELRGDRAN